MFAARVSRPISAVSLAFIALLLVSSPSPRAEALSGADKAWQILEAAIHSNHTGERVTGTRLLGLLPGDSRAVSLVGQALADAKPEVRTAAATAIGLMRCTACIPQLKQALSDKELSVTLAAAHALILMKENTAYDVYYSILTGARKDSKGLIAEQLDTVRDPKKLASFGFSEGIGYVPFAGMGWDAFRAIRKGDSSAVRAAAASVLANDPDPSSGQALLEATHDKNWVVQVAALEAIAKRGDKALQGKIEPAMFDPKSEVRLTAAAAVIHLADVSARVKQSN